MKKFDRVTSILIYLQTKNLVTARELATRFNVSQRTIYRDLRSLENAGIPLGAEPGLGYYLDKSYHLPAVAFSRPEATALLLAAKMTTARVDAVTADHFTSALEKIRALMQAEDQHYLELIDESIAVYQPTASKDHRYHWLSVCRESIAQTQLMQIVYLAGSSTEATTRYIEAIGLYFNHDHWHLIAWCRLRQDYRDFRLDRIQTLEQMPARFKRRAHANLQAFLNRTQNQTLYEVVILFSFDSLRFVGEQKYSFGYVSERQTDAGVEMTFVTAYLDYIARWLLQFASGAKSDTPALKSVMQKLIAQLDAVYC